MTIEKYLVLNKYLLSLFGLSDFKDLQTKMRDAPSGVDSDGRSHFVNILRSSFDGLRKDRLPADDLLAYDANIQSYAKKISFHREPVSLKYFQYLAVFFAEIVLDNIKNREAEFLCELNEFLAEYAGKEDVGLIDGFTTDDLKKLAFWMATGSGKTLIGHINYYQFFQYKLFSPDNIIFITPGEGLSKQHFDEMQKSGIPCRLYGGSLTSLGTSGSGREVLIIEMTKLVEEKKGGGVTLPIDVFEGRNLVFVDEGHKGKKSEEQKWARLRDRLAESGFVFEYSATFGQILSESNKETLREYAKSIVFDYSYRYFYLDGYGKDFSVLNVKQSGSVDARQFQETMFVANLLSFYQQLSAYEDNRELAGQCNLERPLWIFVGTTVTGKEEPDIVQIIELLAKFVRDESWFAETAAKILDGDTGLKGADDKDVFAGKFPQLKKSDLPLDDIYKRVLGGKGNFTVSEMKNASGELGLKAGDNSYFGVINVGNVTGLKKLLDAKNITINQDAISDSLFDAIKKEKSRVNILIGSKKFIEGWDTWRVTSMGLLNIGTGQGPQIIQLFGRGVRLKGKEMSLKRSGEKTPVEQLESLDIYSIKADYLNKFLEAIGKEDVEFETIEVPVQPELRPQWSSLYTLSKDERKKFEEDVVLKLEIDPLIHVTVDLLPRVSTLDAHSRGKDGIKGQQLVADSATGRFTEDDLALMDWDRISGELHEFKTLRTYWNLVFDRAGLRDLLASDRYVVKALPGVLQVKENNDVARLEEVAILVLKKYLDTFYKKRARRFESDNLRYDTVAKQLPLPMLVSEGTAPAYGYTVQVDRKKKDLVKTIRGLVKDMDKLAKDDMATLCRVHFDRHLYVPILLQDKAVERISPPGLVESEEKFITGLRAYLKTHHDKLKGTELFLLRNVPKSGVGFFNLSGFYPDFIMWLKHGKKQTVVFIDPKGMEHSKELDNEKVHLFEDLKQKSQDLGNKNVLLDSFILSATPHHKLVEGMLDAPTKQQYLAKHVIFLDDLDWPETLFKQLGTAT